MAYLAGARFPIAGFLTSRQCVRYMSGASADQPASPPTLPWFLRGPGAQNRPRIVPREVETAEARPPPEGVPEHIISIHAMLSTTPSVDPASLRIGPPISRPLPSHRDYQPLKGKRKRGLRYAGEGVGEPAGFWKWVVVVQVKEGTESRGAVEAVLRSTRKMLIEKHPDVSLPPRARRQATDGWAMLDLGETAVHVVSRTAREKWFPDEDDDQRDPTFDMATEEIQLRMFRFQ